MSLRKSPRLTVARLEANRRNAQKSTGPWTARGKAQSRLNGLRTGLRSRFREDLVYALMTGPLGAVDRRVADRLTPAMAAHPVFAETLNVRHGAAGANGIHPCAAACLAGRPPGSRRLGRGPTIERGKRLAKKSFEQSQNVIENKGQKNTKLGISYDVYENTAT